MLHLHIESIPRMDKYWMVKAFFGYRFPYSLIKEEKEYVKKNASDDDKLFYALLVTWSASIIPSYLELQNNNAFYKTHSNVEIIEWHYLTLKNILMDDSKTDRQKFIKIMRILMIFGIINPANVKLDLIFRETSLNLEKLYSPQLLSEAGMNSVPKTIRIDIQGDFTNQIIEMFPKEMLTTMGLYKFDFTSHPSPSEADFYVRIDSHSFPAEISKSKKIRLITETEEDFAHPQDHAFAFFVSPSLDSPLCFDQPLLRMIRLIEKKESISSIG